MTTATEHKGRVENMLANRQRKTIKLGEIYEKLHLSTTHPGDEDTRQALQEITKDLLLMQLGVQHGSFSEEAMISKMSVEYARAFPHNLEARTSSEEWAKDDIANAKRIIAKALGQTSEMAR